MRRDVIVVASVSCIYGLGSPEEYRDRILGLAVGDQLDQRDILRRLVDLQYARNDVNLVRGTFRARGDTVELHPAYEEQALRVEMFGDTVERIVPFDVLTGEMGEEMEDVAVYAATHYVTGDDIIQRAVGTIEVELRERLQEFESGRASCSRHSGFGSARSTISRCWPRRGSARAWRTTAGISTAGRRRETPYTLLVLLPQETSCA